MIIRRRLRAVAGVTVLVGGLAVGTAIVLPGVANATACTSALPGATCTLGGTVTLTTGGLNMITPPSLAWSATLNGAQQTMYDTTATGVTGGYTSHTAFYVQDYRGLLSGAGSGWNVTATATTFTGTASVSNTIVDNATAPGKVLSYGGGSTAGTATNTPTAQCMVTLTCSVPTTSLTAYPLYILTGGAVTPVKIYNAPLASGSGFVQVGAGYVAGANPGVFAVTIPALQAIDTYTSTITMSVSAGP